MDLCPSLDTLLCLWVRRPSNGSRLYVSPRPFGTEPPPRSRPRDRSRGRRWCKRSQTKDLIPGKTTEWSPVDDLSRQSKTEKFTIQVVLVLSRQDNGNWRLTGTEGEWDLSPLPWNSPVGFSSVQTEGESSPPVHLVLWYTNVVRIRLVRGPVGK